MIRRAVFHYLIDGKPVGKIASELNETRAAIRAQLKAGGITIRPVNGIYPLGRGPVCNAIRRLGFNSFHEFAQVNSLTPITEQSAMLNVSEKSLARVYNAYRRLLIGMKSAGTVLPTSQTRGAELDQRAGGD